MKKQVISFLLVLCIVMSFLPFGVSAADIVKSGKCGTNLTYVLDSNGLLTISGTGAMDDYGYNTPPWYGNQSAIKSVVAEEGVTSIGYKAFSRCSYLKDVALPDSLTRIGGYAFEYCTYSLQSITIPKNVRSIGSCAFDNCYPMESINVDPDNTVYSSIDGVLFNKAQTQLIRYPCGKKDASYTIPNTVTAIDSDAFFGCKLKEVIIPEGVTRIPNGAFWSSSLKSATIPVSVTSIGTGAFWYCSGLTDIYYAGSKVQWNRITISNEYSRNEPLLNATIHCAAISTDQTIDDAIVEKVKKYTSDSMLAQYSEIMGSGFGYEEIFRRLNGLFKNGGITDPREGVKYLTEAYPYVMAYKMMTTDDLYCANNYYEWLNYTPSGQRARTVLYLDGLIFNYEALSYLDLSTYTENDYPGVKKNKVLLKMVMEDSRKDALSDISSYTNIIAKFLKSALKINNIVEDSKMESLMDRILISTSATELEELQNQFAEMIVNKCNAQGSEAIYCSSELISKALKTSSNIIKFAGATASDISAIINLEKDISLYQQYSRFLESVYSDTSVSFEMRLAAYQLLDDINEGYFNKISALLTHMFDNGKDFIYTDTSLIATALEQLGISASSVNILSNAVSTLTLSTFVSNLVIDTGDFVKQIAYTQGYAELASAFCKRLEADKDAFLQNETPEHAWAFFEDYTMLWNLRYQGEKQYLKMNEVKALIFGKIPTYGYKEKKQIVDDNLAMLEKNQFSLDPNFAIPDSVQYAKKAVIQCPVEVDVFTENGELLLTMHDGAESNIVNEYGRFSVVHDSYSGEYVKVICQNPGNELRFKLRAINNGLVDYVQADLNSDESVTFDKVKVLTGDVIELNQSNYQIEHEDGEHEEVDYVLKQNNVYVPVETAALTKDKAELKPGESEVIGVYLFPSDASNTAVEWLSSDDSVVTVQNGVLSAREEGTAIVFARICDAGQEIVLELPVVVETEHRPEEERINKTLETCTEAGYSGDIVCTICGEILVQGEEIPAKGHDWGKWEISKLPSATAEGEKSRKCILCDEIETMPIPVLESDAISILLQPQDIAAAVGDNVSVSVTAMGEGLVYRWQYRQQGKNTWYDSSMPGSTTDTLQVAVTAKRDGQAYRCVITDAYGESMTSDPATLTIAASQTSLAITSQPQDVTGAVGETVIATVVATGESLSYQWQYRLAGKTIWYDSTMTGAKTAAPEIPVTAKREGESYRCIVTDASGASVMSEPATLTIAAPQNPLSITSQPEDVSGSVGETVTVSVTAQGEGLTYQWQYRLPGKTLWYTSAMEGSATDTLQIPVTSRRDGQSYRCVIKDASGNTVKSDPATLTIGSSYDGIVITTQPKDVNAAVGTTVFMIVRAEGEGLTFQWQYQKAGKTQWFNSTLPGADTDTLEVQALSNRDGQSYRCIITSAGGETVTTDHASLAIGILRILPQLF